MQKRGTREGRLMLARRRLETANDALRVAHALPRVDEIPAKRADLIQRAQELVVTIEQEVALLSTGLDRDYPDADTSYTAIKPSERSD
jgi:hypothetical protein